MTDERRYQDDEVAAIFEAASAPTASNDDDVPAEQGLTLAELQAIGREVGIDPERIAQAAASLQRSRPPIPPRTDLGLPVTAAHVVDIPRPPTDLEWLLVVGDLRQTFGAWGRESSHGETRIWRNHNLHAVVEPTRTGYRLRLGTLKADGLAMNRMGAFGVTMGIVIAIALGGDPAAIPGVLALATMGASAFAFNALRLPRWAQLRERQMRAVADRTLGLLTSTPRLDGA
jgi:hypothetical protein